nr:hypothetical protein [Tanacetum cinerariifolium]
MALISLSFKKIYKPTNNKLQTSSNTNRANQDNSPRINRGTRYENQRIGNVVGARETVGTTVVQKSGIQCYNCKEFGHVARECHKPKRVKDPTYHREKMLLCKQKEAGIQLNAEQADWKDDTDDEYDDQELEAHYIEQIDQNDDDTNLVNERELLASLIEKLKCEIDESKNRNKFLETSNKVLVEKLKGEIEDFKNKNKSLESSNNQFKEATNKLSETNKLLYDDFKKSQAELKRRDSMKYASEMELECAKVRGDFISYKTESQKSFTNYTHTINDLNQTISEMKNKLSEHQETISILTQQKEAQIKLYKTREDNELDKVITLENKVKVLDNIVYKTGQSVQTMNMLNSKCQTSFAKPEFLKKAQRENPRLYDIGCYNDKLALILASESDEVIRLEKESRSKLSDLIRPFDYNKLNNLYDLFVPQREKSSEQRYFSERSRLSHIVVNNGNSNESFNKQTTLLEKRMDESIPLDKQCRSYIEHFKVKTYVNTIFQGVELCKESIAKRTYVGYVDPFIKNTIEANFCPEIQRIQSGLHQFHRCLNEKMVADLRYFNSLELEVDSLRSQLETQKTQYEVTNLQCDYLKLLEKCDCLEKEFSKSKMMSKSFETVQKHAIGLELELQQYTAQILPSDKKSILKNTNVLAPGMYKVHIEPTQTSTSQLPNDFRKTNKCVSFSIGVIPTTSVSRPQLKSNPIEDRVMLNISQGKKQEVEDHRRNVKFSMNKTSVTACNDSLNAKKSNVNFVCVTCGISVLNGNHDKCVRNDVNSRTTMPMVVPVSTREPNQSVEKPIRKTTDSESNQKLRNTLRKIYERVRKTCSWWYIKFTPSGYMWKPKSTIGNVNPNLIETILFIVDSGCSKHMTRNLKLLINFVEKFMGTVKFGNDQIAPILGYGDLVQGAVTIKRVYYVEGLNHNLFSVGQFCDADLEVTFRKSTYYIRDLKGNDLLTGSRGTDLYSITLHDTNFPNTICLMAKATSSQAWLWHHRLSYLNFDTINLLSKNDIVVGLPKLTFVKDHLCSSCELGKAKRKGLQAQVRIVRTDKGSEFLNQTLHAYFAAEGILHQTSVARTPEQNGIVERRNRTLVEAARTMLSAANVPLFFWAEAIATACFTHNRSLVIPRHEKTPYHIINDRKPSVKFFYIFGSICYIIRDGENLDKMKEKGDACIFVGYSTQSRAYRVFNKRTRVIVESIHVNFDELPQMASDHISSDPAPECPTMALEHDRLSPRRQCQENVPHVDKTVTTSNELDLLFSLMFDELLNGSSQVKEKQENDKNQIKTGQKREAW